MDGTFSAFGRDHHLTLGGNWAEDDGRGRSVQSPGQQTIFDPDSFDPRSSLPLDEAMMMRISAMQTRPFTTVETNGAGIYGKLDFKLLDDLSVIIGGRMTWFDYSSRLTTDPATILIDDSVRAQFTPYAGLIYTISPEWSAYASYTNIFRPQFGNWLRDGSRPDHLYGNNYEIGIKGELLGGRLNTALAFYRVDLENSLVSELPPFDQACPGNPTGAGCVVAAGKQRTQGIDLEITGELLPRWQVSASYTYAETEVLEADSQVGAPFSFMPRHLVKLWTTYRLGGALSGLSIGGGMTGQSREHVVGDFVTLGWDDYAQDGFTVWNAFARYEFNENWELSLNLNNIFDKVYFPNDGGSIIRADFETPRNFLLALRARY